MRIAQIKIKNFRGIAKAELLLPKHAVFVGDNNSGKSTILEAIDLVLGPDRLSRRPVVDEHDFYAGRYIGTDDTPIEIQSEVVVIDLSDEQTRHFKYHLEWWDTSRNGLLQGPPAEKTDANGVFPALRVGFTGAYDKEEDDFLGSTYFLSPVRDDGDHDWFRTVDKRLCGFLFLRTLRTGSRALSLERGSLLDIILRLQEERLHMWEDVLAQLRKLPVAENPDLGITEILSSVQKAVRAFVPSEWAENPHMRVSDLTRENLRRILTVFMSTGAKLNDGTDYAAPFQHQGTGTINALVLALLSLVAELKQNVIFAMEEPEIAIPPHTQKRIIDSVRKNSAQALFTSHSPYVLEEFKPEQIIVVQRNEGVLTGTPTTYPPAVKPKAYRMAVRTRFCEAMLARRILIAEGRTEYDAFPAAARRLHHLHPEEFDTLEGLGIAVVNAETDSQVAPLGKYFSRLGKTVFAVFDKQTPESKAAIEEAVDHAYEAPQEGFEDVLLNGTDVLGLRRYAAALVKAGEWPLRFAKSEPTETTSPEALREALHNYLSWSKGAGGAADLLIQCTRAEMPQFIVDTLRSIKKAAQPVPDQEASPKATAGEETQAE